LLGPNTVSAEGFYIFLSKYSKGNPCHGILLIYINKKRENKGSLYRHPPRKGGDSQQREGENKLSKGIDNIQEKGFFGDGKSMSLKGGLLKEPLFPVEKGGSSTIEDSIIPLFSN
jgi:hypothetical protein